MFFPTGGYVEAILMTKMCAVLVFVALWCPAIHGASPLQVRMSPVYEFYHLGEPVEIRLSIYNAGDKEVQFFFQYPRDAGVFFTCGDDGATVVPVGPAANRRVPVVRLPAGKTYERVIALSRYVRLSKVKTYTVDFLAEYREPVSKENPTRRTFSTKGDFTIRVEPRPIDDKRLREYVKILDDKDAGETTMEDAWEMLLWTDDRMVIDPIVRAAKRMPNWGQDAVESLGKFFHEDCARTAILDLAIEGNTGALQSALHIYQDLKTAFPMVACKSVLASENDAKVYAMLEFLLTHGGAEHVPFIQPLEQYKNPNIRKLASKVLAAIAEQKPAQK